MGNKKRYEAIVIGTSAGGLHALTAILQPLPGDYPIPIVVVQHRSKDQRHLFEDVLQSKCSIKIKQADEKEQIKPGNVYTAPPDYHLLIESDHSFSLTADEQVLYSRPSINVLFESAAIVYGNKLAGIILTGANNDGAAGIARIRACGGLTIAQAPAEAQFPVMPGASIETKKIQHIWTLEQIQKFLLQIGNG